MPYAPLISKIRCHNPNRKGSQKANKNYLTYIATREGVDVSQIKDVEDILKIRPISEIEINDDFLHQYSDNDTYLKYMAERPRSHGLFGNVDTDDLKGLAKKVSDMTKEGRCIYRGIISFSQADAEALGYTDKNNWELYMKQVMPDIAKELGVSQTNFTWVAAFHAEKTHPHVHYELWDNRNKVKSPYIHKSVQNKCRILLSEAAFDENYEKMILDITKEERAELNQIRNKSRAELKNITIDILSDTDEFIPGLKNETLPDRITSDDIQAVAKDLIRLTEILPGKGSYDYAYQKPEVKAVVDEITDSLLQQRADMRIEFYKYMKAIEDGKRLVGKTRFDIEIAQDRAKKDIYNRIGNVILKKVRTLTEFEKSAIDEHQDVVIEKDSTDSNDDAIVPDYEEKTIGNNDDYSEGDMMSPPDNLDNMEDEKLRDEKIDDTNEKFYMKWSAEYKESLKFLYDKEDQDFSAAFRLLKREAERGNVLAIHDIGKVYEKGLGKETDADLAHENYKKALQGFLEIESDRPREYVEYRIGKFYDAGKGTERDYAKAAEWYGKSVMRGYKSAQYSLGMLYLKEKIQEDGVDNFKEAFSLFKSSAAQGNAYASYELARMYQKGLGMEKDSQLAHDNYKRAFEGFNAMLQEREDDNLLYRVGDMYLKGLGTEKDLVRAEECFLAASKLRNETAQYALAKMYLDSGNLDKVSGGMTMLHKLADNGFDMAQHSLGKIYTDPKNKSYNIETGLYWLEKAGQEGNSFSQYHMGTMYLRGKQVARDLDKAYDCLRASADQKNDYAMYGLGKLHLEDDVKYYNVETALGWLEKAAEYKNPDAQYYLGDLYRKGDHVPKDMDMAHANYKRAFEGFNAMLQEREDDNLLYRVGDMYLKGLGTEKNLVRAEECFLAASKLKNDTAQHSLAKMYLDSGNLEKVSEGMTMLHKLADNGFDMAQHSIGKIYTDPKNKNCNVEIGLYWLEKASQNGNSFSQYHIGSLYLRGKQLPKDLDKAYDYFKMSVDQRNDCAMYGLGKLHLENNVKYYNVKTALEWLEKAVENKNSNAQYYLGNLYLKGEHVLKNVDRAYEYFKAAADKDYDNGMYGLGCIYSNPENKNYYDMDRALYYLEKAAHKGNEMAQNKLGIIYIWGKGVDKNEELGKYWLNEAIKKGNEFAKESMEMYENYKNRVLPGIGYGLIKTSFSTLLQSRQEEEWRGREIHKSRSKQAMKEEALKNQIRGMSEND